MISWGDFGSFVRILMFWALKLMADLFVSLSFDLSTPVTRAIALAILFFIKDLLLVIPVVFAKAKYTLQKQFIIRLI